MRQNKRQIYIYLQQNDSDHHHLINLPCELYLQVTLR